MRRFRIWIKRLFAPLRRRRWLFLDDMRNPPAHLVDHFDVVRDFDGFTEHIEAYGIPRLISFDHDLHPEHTMFFYEGYGWCGPCENRRGFRMAPTGYDCAVWLVDYCNRNDVALGQVCVHSPNPVTAQRIVEVITEHQTEKNTDPSCRIIKWDTQGIRRG